MILQVDKETSQALGRERAHSLLYDELDATHARYGEPTNSFSFNHDTSDFKSIVFEKYNHVVQPVEEAADITLNTAAFSQYISTEPAHHADLDTTQQEYHNPSKPYVYQSYRPRVISDFEEVVHYAAPADAALEKLAEIEVQEIIPTAQPTAKIEHTVAATQQTHAEHYLKLNARGMIAVATFAVVTLMVIVMIALNISAINASSARVNTLRAQNNDQAAVYSQVMQERANALEFGINRASTEQQFASYRNPNTIQQATEMPPASAHELLPPASLPRTSVFDRMVKFLSSIF
jgi:hypothetical protein